MRAAPGRTPAMKRENEHGAVGSSACVPKSAGRQRTPVHEWWDEFRRDKRRGYAGEWPRSGAVGLASPGTPCDGADPDLIMDHDSWPEGRTLLHWEDLGARPGP